MLRGLLADLRAQKLRAALTILGITWGTVAVVLLTAFGEGLGRQVRKNARGVGTRIMVVFGGRTNKPYRGFAVGRSIRLTERDAELLRQRVPLIAQMSPEYTTRLAQARRGTRAITPVTTGVVPEYAEIRNVIPETGGRFLNARDVALQRRVVFIGDGVARALFGDAPAVGAQLRLGAAPFTVIGVLRHKEQSSSYQSRDENRVFIPISTYRATFADRYLNDLVLRGRSPAESGRLKAAVYAALGARHGFDPADTDALFILDTTMQEALFNALFGGLNAFFALVGGFTLTVGGIGVANIMYVVVRERTREIGIRRAVGASRRDILRQFFLEACAVVGIGAALGLTISVALVLAAARFAANEFVGTPVLSGTVLVVTAVLLGLVALLAGILPARQAARVDVVEALRS